jgi:LPXTG-motif cell wall-anchored protein
MLKPSNRQKIRTLLAAIPVVILVTTCTGGGFALADNCGCSSSPSSSPVPTSRPVPSSSPAPTSAPTSDMYGNTPTPTGLYGNSAPSTGLYGNSTPPTGLYGNSTPPTGLYGNSQPPTGLYGDSTLPSNYYGTAGTTGTPSTPDTGGGASAPLPDTGATDLFGTAFGISAIGFASFMYIRSRRSSNKPASYLKSH